MTLPTPTLLATTESVRQHVDAEMSRHLQGAGLSDRETVAVACRILAHEGHAQSLAGQVTKRLDDETFWTTHFACGLRDATADNLVRFDRDMQVIEGDGMPNPAVRFHLWIYAHRPELRCIVHTHPPHVAALSMLGEPLEIAHMDAMMLYESCAFLSDWPGVPLANEEGRIISEALGDKPAILLAHHGLLTAAASVERATYMAVALESAARLHLLARAAGTIRAPVPQLAREACEFLNKRAIVDATFAYWARHVIREHPEVLETKQTA